MIVTAKDILGWELVGKIGNQGDPDPLNILGIYRRRPTREGVTLVKMDFYFPANPQTQQQQAWRTTFANGVASWQNLNEGERDGYRESAKEMPMTGFNLYLSQFLLT